ncbi:MAG: fibronectin type III domain-containing protein, partial [Thermoguttaceae bacterium]|nr:fibronectin type III domain-containing protein [Thermoguttaceae bacterium]
TSYKTIKTKSLATLTTPTITSLTSDQRTIDVAWKAVSGATGYGVSYRSSNSTESDSIYVPVDNTSYSISNLTPGTSYTIGVVAYGDQKTADSKEATKKISTKSLATLAQPTITTVTSDFREISVEWKLVDGAQGYVAICSSSTTNEDVRVDLPSGETSYRFVNLTPGVSYKVKVVAKGDGIDTSDSKDTAYKTIKTKSLPTLATPTITSLTSDKRTINVAWKSVPDATGYYVSYRSLNSPEGDSFHILADETSYTFVKLTPGTSYTVGVVAYGDLETADSKEATKKISTKSLATLTQPMITSLTSDKHSIEVAWKAVKNASGYQVSYSVGNSSDRTYEYVDAETTRFSVSKLTPGTSYTVRVVALGDGLDTQNSKDTSYKKITTKSLETLATPTITSSTSDKRSIAFSWNAVTGATLYEVSYTTASGGFVTRAVQADQTSYTFSDLAPGTAYTVKVVAQGDYFNTANSKEATKKISTKSLVTLAQPTITSLTSDKRSINVAWKAVKNASGYQVSYSTA